MLTLTTPLQDLFDIVIYVVKGVQQEETFIVRDLFRGFL